MKIPAEYAAFAFTDEEARTAGPAAPAGACIEFLPFDQALEIKRLALRRAAGYHTRAASGSAASSPALDLEVPVECRCPLRRCRLSEPPGRSTLARWFARSSCGGIVAEPPLVTHAAIFLELVEPTIDGLPRVLAACERTHRFVELSTGNSSIDDETSRLRRYHLLSMLVSWSDRVGALLKLNFHGEDEEDIEAGLYIATWVKERITEE